MSFVNRLLCVSGRRLVRSGVSACTPIRTPVCTTSQADDLIRNPETAVCYVRILDVATQKKCRLQARALRLGTAF